jgi:hypothetical protein
VLQLKHYAERHYHERHYAEGSGFDFYADCHDADCCCAEGCHTECFMLFGMMLIVVGSSLAHMGEVNGRGKHSYLLQ